MTETYLSITIRPPIAEFAALKIPMDIFISYMKPDEYIVSLEKGKAQKEGHNHYQIALKTGKNINTIRKAINRFFKPHLFPSTLKKGVWKKVKTHNNKVSIIGYCLKEGHIYSTNIEETKLKAELELYNSYQPKKKAIKCNGNCNYDEKLGRKMLFLYTCDICRFPAKHSPLLTGVTRPVEDGV